MRPVVVFISLMICGAASTAENIPDAVMADPDGYWIALENEYVRVLELRAEPGHRIPFHVQPSRAAVVVNGARIRITRRGGTSELIERKPGDVFWEEAGEYSLEVVAGSLHQIETEIRPGIPPRFVPSARDVTEITPELARVVYESAHVRVVDLRGEPGQQFPFHFHQARVTVRLGSSRMKFTDQNGTTRLSDFHVGEVSWGDAVEHSDVVLSGSFHLVLVEVKSQTP